MPFGASDTHVPFVCNITSQVRYVSDMLAWVHQSVAAECDLIRSIFGDIDALVHKQKHNDAAAETEGDEDSDNSDPGVFTGDDVMDSDVTDMSVELKSVSDMMTHICEGITRPLHSRIDGVLDALLKDGNSCAVSCG